MSWTLSAIPAWVRASSGTEMRPGIHAQLAMEQEKLMDADGLIVASIYKWVYQDLAQAAGDFPVRYSHGFDIPKIPNKIRRPAIWTSTEFAARLKHNGMDLPLIAPGPNFLSNLPKSLLGRDVFTWSLGQAYKHLLNDYERHWVKLAEMKDGRFPAQHTFLRDFILAATEAGAPDGTQIQISSENMCIVAEYRCVVLDGKVVSNFPYMQLGEIWNIDLDQHYWQPSEWAREFAQYAVNTFGKHQPRAYTLDIAQVMHDPEDCRMDSHYVLEVNPIWSSALYGADPAVVLPAILAGVDYTGTSDWMWKPDPWLVQKATAKVAMKNE